MRTSMGSFFQRFKRVFQKSAAISDGIEPHVRQARADPLPGFVTATEERSRTIELLLRLAEERAKTLESLLVVAEERTRTLEYVAQQSLFAHNHQIDFLQKLYVEAMPRLLDLNARPAFNAASFFELKTDHPIALGSNDHINPDSTTEGVSRPTLFVQDCIRVLGSHMKILDLGSGAAGLVFEFAMNGVPAVGIDGSDFCRINRVGYWPLLPNNLFTCDITKPFSFVSQGTEAVTTFDVITMWEVLEHIAEPELAGLFVNIARHLGNEGYFIGSVSIVEYVDSAGSPYHVTLKPRDWWKAKFIECGLVMLDTHPFNEKLFCRGNGPRFQDFHNYALQPNEGFWFVAQKASTNARVAA